MNIDKIDYNKHPLLSEAELLSMYTPNTVLDMDMILATKDLLGKTLVLAVISKSSTHRKI